MLKWPSQRPALQKFLNPRQLLHPRFLPRWARHCQNTARTVVRDAINIEQFELERDSSSRISSRIFEKHQQPSPASANVEISEKNLTGNSSPREMFSPQEIDLSTACLLLIFLYSPARAVKWKKEYAGICEN